ncbi:MAG: BamA/TamA family outer membrane protein [Bacteroidetes bacterium]|jgi:outer membrane protein insertion porin family|nr:BamA/TamA family outer membrane protein [Bacteroidota bacterium]
MRRPATYPGRLLGLLGVLLLLLAPTVQAQAPLFLINEDTQVRDVDFKFAETPTFDEGRLLEQIATAEPTFLTRVRRTAPLSWVLTTPLPPFDPITLQKDVVRLRRFYQNHGFLTPQVDYPTSQLDTTNNTIRVIFSIEEGPPLIIQDVGFFGPDGGYAASLFEGDGLRERWIAFRDRTSFQVGDRYTDFELLRIRDAVLAWLRDRGFAFARVNAETTIDSTAYTADIRFELDPGPQGVVSDIIVDGNETVSKEIILRELPLKVGRRFSYSKLIQGQRELFALNLFRVALADVPPTDDADDARVDSLAALNDTTPDQLRRQPRDSTVEIRYRVREAKLRYLTAQTGYSRSGGVSLRGDWTHRNFLGSARTFTVSATSRTGLLGRNTGGLASLRQFRLGLNLRQPFLFTTRLSANVEPFAQYASDPFLSTPDDPIGPGFVDRLGLNRRELGVNATLVYEIYPFRTVSLQSSFSRLLQEGDSLDIAQRDVPDLPPDQLFDTADPFSKNIFRLSGSFGDADDFLNPQRGFFVRPFVEDGGRLIASGIETVRYLKSGAEVVGYLPLTDGVSLGGRIFGGRIWPRGDSRDQFAPRIENRFDPIRFYSGGGDDVRGWGLRLLGPQQNRTTLARDADGAVLFNTDDDGTPTTPQTNNEQYEAVGGLAKAAANVELRLPFPGLGSKWRTAVFLDVGQVSARRASGDPFVVLDERFQDDGTLDLALDAFRFGTGGGIRYQTPIGFIRLDLAFKLNPDRRDLLRPREAFLDDLSGLSPEEKVEQGLPPDFTFEASERFIRRFNVHLSLGQTF